jgi:hypothetical protein
VGTSEGFNFEATEKDREEGEAARWKDCTETRPWSARPFFQSARVSTTRVAGGWIETSAWQAIESGGREIASGGGGIASGVQGIESLSQGIESGSRGIGAAGCGFAISANTNRRFQNTYPYGCRVLWKMPFDLFIHVRRKAPTSPPKIPRKAATPASKPTSTHPDSSG